jgi:hypothetical protein
MLTITSCVQLVHIFFMSDQDNPENKNDVKSFLSILY